MVRSTFISFGLHSFLITLAYFGLPALKVKEPIEQPIDIVDNTPVSNKTSLKLGNEKEAKEKKTKEETIKEKKIKKVPPPPPPPMPTKKIVEKKNLALKKEKEIKEIATLIKKKPKIDINKKKKSSPPKIVKKPEKIKNKQKESLAKGILKTLTKPKVVNEKIKKDKSNSNNQEVLKKIKTIVGNSNRQVQQTEIKLSQTDINRIQMHVTKYFNLSYAATEVKIIIPLKIRANTDGTIKSARILDKSNYKKDKFYKAAADAARRAVLDSSPLPLPKGKEKKFENFILDFDTSFINNY